MKYTYAYKTSDGTRHEESMIASSREEVFAELRKRGIKAIKVIAADGSKANGEVRGVRKRIVAMFVCIAAIITGVTVYFAPVKSTPTQRIARYNEENEQRGNAKKHGEVDLFQGIPHR